MAVTNEKSTQVTNLTASPVVLPPADEYMGRVRYALGQFVQGAAIGDANSTIDLVQVPPGARICPQSQIFTDALLTGRTLDVGHTAHTQADGTAVAAAVDKFIDGLDVSSAVLNAPFGTGTNGTDDFQFVEEIKEGFALIQAKVLGGTIAAAAKVRAHVYFVKD